MNPNRAPSLPSSAKLIAALPVVLGASEASAAVIYTDFGPGGITAQYDILFDLNGSYGFDTPSPYHFSLFAKGSFSVNGLSAGGGQGTVADSGGVFLFDTGQTIGPSSGLTFSTSQNGSPIAGTPAYLGLRYEFNGTTTYGWARAQWTTYDHVTLFSVAYEDSGASILTGDTGASPIPEPGATAALAGLAAGAVAAFTARQKRKARAAASSSILTAAS